MYDTYDQREHKLTLVTDLLHEIQLEWGHLPTADIHLCEKRFRIKTWSMNKILATQNHGHSKVPLFLF